MCRAVSGTMGLASSHVVRVHPVVVQVTVEAAFNDAEGNVFCTTHTFELPLALFAQVVPPVKSNAQKLTIAISEAPAPVGTLFEDLVRSSPPQSAMV